MGSIGRGSGPFQRRDRVLACPPAMGCLRHTLRGTVSYLEPEHVVGRSLMASPPSTRGLAWVGVAKWRGLASPS